MCTVLVLEKIGTFQEKVENDFNIIYIRQKVSRFKDFPSILEQCM